MRDISLLIWINVEASYDGGTNPDTRSAHSLFSAGQWICRLRIGLLVFCGVVESNPSLLTFRSARSIAPRSARCRESMDFIAGTRRRPCLSIRRLSGFEMNAVRAFEVVGGSIPGRLPALFVTARINPVVPRYRKLTPSRGPTLRQNILSVIVTRVCCRDKDDEGRDLAVDRLLAGEIPTNKRAGIDKSIRRGLSRRLIVDRDGPGPVVEAQRRVGILRSGTQQNCGQENPGEHPLSQCWQSSTASGWDFQSVDGVRSSLLSHGGSCHL